MSKCKKVPKGNGDSAEIMKGIRRNITDWSTRRYPELIPIIIPRNAVLQTLDIEVEENLHPNDFV